MNSKNNSNVAAFSAADLVDFIGSEEVGGGGGGVGVNAENEVEAEAEVSVEGVSVIGKESAAESADASPLPFSLKSASRPGITSERIQNIFDPYITGIAVRP